MGVHILTIKDMAGLLVPYKATELVTAMKSQTKLPIQLHTHYTSGVASMTYLKAVEAGIISKRGDYYYFREDGSPVCGNNEDPTFTVAAKYLSLPQNQELKFSIEAKLN